MIKRLVTLQIFPANTSDKRILDGCLEAVESEPLITPTHASKDERKRAPYDRSALVEAAGGRKVGGAFLWRAKMPKYTHGSLSTSNISHNKITVDYDAGLNDESVPLLFEAWARLAENLRPEFGFVHGVPDIESPSAAAYNYGLRLKIKDLRDNGFRLIHPRTWFGPDLVSVIGKERLLDLPHTRTTSWGGVQLDLVEEPWAADFETMYERQRDVMRIFSAWGLMGDYSSVVRAVPGPRWTPRLWKL